MSSENVQALVHYGDWSNDSDGHPAMAWMRKYTEMVDRKVWDSESWSDWYTEDYVLIKSDGQVVKGGEPGWDALAQIYGPFVKYHHEPYFFVCTETDYGWQMIGQAHLYATLPGQPASGEPPKVKDQKGREFDVVIPAGFKFEYKKDSGSKHGPVKLQKIELMSDSLPIVMMLAKRGVIQLG